jgi:preprotein translocase subunit SecE
MANRSPIQFINEVRAEASKVTWPSRKETMITTAMVFLLVVVASLFFLVVDKVIFFVLGILLG